MLVLNRRIGEQIDIYWHGEKITVTLCSAWKGRGKIGIEAPEEAKIVRRELPPLQKKETVPV
jgi:carbon storage regulator CsrA